MIWYWLGKSYARSKKFSKAAKYLLKAQRYFRTPVDYVTLAEALHNIDQSEEALKIIAKAFERFPSSSYLYERRAFFLSELNREEEAIADLDEAIRLNPDSFINWYTRGIVHQDLGHYGKAIRDLKEAIKREDPDTVISTYYELAKIYYTSGNLEEAARYFKKTVHTHASVPIYYYMLSTTLHEIGRTEEAIRYLEEGMKLLDVYEAHPDKGFSIFAEVSHYSYGAFKSFQSIIEPTYSFRKDLAEMYMAIGKYDLAVKTITSAMKKNPETPQLYLIRANMYLASEKWEEAEEDIRSAIQLEPINLEGYFELAKCYRIQGNEHKELDIYMKLLDVDPESPIIYYRIAEVYMRLNQFDKALDYNNRLLAIEDDDYLNYTQRSEILLAMNRYSDAVHSFDQALELYDDGEIRYHKSYVLYLNGDFDESLEELYSAAQQTPSLMEIPTFHVALGRNYQAIQNFELAIHEFSTAIQMEPDDIDYRRVRAECYLESKQVELAIEDLTLAIQQSPEHPVFYSMRANAYISMRQYELAREDARRWLELEPESPYAYYYLGLTEYELLNLEEAQRMVEQSLKLDSTYYPSYLLKAYIHYAWFEYDECEDWIVQWATTLYAREGKDRMVEAIYSLEGIDKPILEGAASKLQATYGETIYLS